MSPTVNISSGRLEGFQLDRCLAFRGIPFAAPPVNHLRFLPPQPAEPWAGVRSAKEFGNAAPQYITGIDFMDAGAPLSEDCLYLNVYTLSTLGARPVMVWIHGGAFSLGSGAQKAYNDPTIATFGDIVLVTINYRIGPLGFIYLGYHGGNEWGASANLGLLDQIAALQWVQDNIRAFGGDPSNVTIFGESAGSASVAALLAMPKARGLFHKAIGQSGTANLISKPDKAAKVTNNLLKKLKIHSGEAKKLQEKSWEEIIHAAQVMAGPFGAGFGDPMTSFWPVTDGITIPEQPYIAVKEGSAKGVPLIFGSNRDEAQFLEAISGVTFPEINDSQLKKHVKHLLGRWKDHAAILIDVYRDSRKERNLPSANKRILSAIATDMYMRIPALRLLEAQHPHESRVYNYLFCWESPGQQAALHGLEIPFVFGMVDNSNQTKGIINASGPGVKVLSDNMMNAWIAFARTNDPGIADLNWLSYNPDNRATMIYDTHSEMQIAPFEEERALWADIMKQGNM